MRKRVEAKALLRLRMLSGREDKWVRRELVSGLGGKE